VLAELIDELRRHDIAPIAYVTLWDAGERAGRRPGEVLQRADGTSYTSGDDPNVITVRDFTNRAVVDAWEEQVHEILDQGFDGFMQDVGDEVMVGMRFHDGSTGAEMHNGCRPCTTRSAPGVRQLPQEAPKAEAVVLHPVRVYRQPRLGCLRGRQLPRR